MGKIIPINQAKKLQLIKNDDLDDNPVRFSTISLILTVVAIIIEIYIIGKYYGRDPYANYSLLLLILAFIGFGGAFMLNRKGIFKLNDYFIRSRKGLIRFLGYVVALLLTIGLLMVVMRATFRFALDDIDLYLYYLAAGVIEELFFRFFLVSMLRRLKLSYFSVLISSFIFMIAHWEVYGYSFSLMLSMFIGGIIFGLFYIFTKDITINMIAHLTINLLNVGTLLVMMG